MTTQKIGNASIYRYEKIDNFSDNQNGLEVISADFFALSSLPGSHSGAIDGNVFLGGNYLELGISRVGSFGTTAGKPANFFGVSQSTAIGISSDADGFGVGADLAIDYVLPGTPEERWNIGFNGEIGSYSGLNESIGDLLLINTSVKNISSGDNLSAEFLGDVDGRLRVSQVISFGVDDKGFKNTVTLTNISSSALSDLRFMRSFDPDNTIFKGGEYQTQNRIENTFAAGDSKAVVSATSLNDGYSVIAGTTKILYSSSESSARVSAYGFKNTDPYADLAYTSARTKGYSVTEDEAITIAFDLDTLAVGASKTITYYTLLETVGSGNDLLEGTSGNDTLDGGLGNDTLNGKLGNDNLLGGGGDDTYLIAKADGVDIVNDVNGTDVLKFTDLADAGVTETSRIGISGNDLLLKYGASQVTVQGYFSSLDTRIEQFQFSNGKAWGWEDIKVKVLKATAGHDILYGYNDSDDTLNGLAGNDTLYGYGGNDTLDGGVGNDVMWGGTGNDSYSVDSLGDTVHEGYYDGGIDSVSSSVDFGLLGATAYVENLALLAGAVKALGNDLDNTLTGNAAANALTGFDGNDTLIGADGNDSVQGGLGNDILNGGNGLDIAQYWMATAGVTVNLGLATAQNTGGAGTDTLVGIENVNGSGFNDTLVGNAQNNSLLGGAGDDMLNGGDGNDSLQGGLGNDTLNGGNGVDWGQYYLAPAGVTVNLGLATAQNTGGAGTDTLVGIENVNGSGFNDTLVGNAQNNSLLGGAGDDTLNGGEGNDSLQGGLGNDTLNGGNGVDWGQYYLAPAGVTVNLGLATAQNTGGAGTDTLSNLENLNGSAFNDTLTGNSSANMLFGGVGNDSLNGGLGNDVLTGGAGQDSFVFNTAIGITNKDAITDFSVADDTVKLENAIFTALVTPGILSAVAFKVVGSGNAVDADDRVLYNTATGGVLYDADGNGSSAAVLVAVIGKSLAVTPLDFVII